MLHKNVLNHYGVFYDFYFCHFPYFLLKYNKLSETIEYDFHFCLMLLLPRTLQKFRSFDDLHFCFCVFKSTFPFFFAKLPVNILHNEVLFFINAGNVVGSVCVTKSCLQKYIKSDIM